MPDLYVNVDRTMASQVGLQQQDVANSMLISLASSGMSQPMFWVNPKNGVQYPVAVETPRLPDQFSGRAAEYTRDGGRAYAAATSDQRRAHPAADDVRRTSATMTSRRCSTSMPTTCMGLIWDR